MRSATYKNPSFWIGLYLVLVLLALTSIGPYYDFQTMVLFILLPSLFVVALIYDIRTFNIGNREFIIFLLLTLLTLTTVFYDYQHEMFIKAFNGMLGAAVAAYIPIGLNKNSNYQLYFHLGFVLSIIALLLIEYQIGNFNIREFANVRGSRGRFQFNANYYSYIGYFANFSLFYLHLKYRNFLTVGSLVLLPALILIMAFITQSRSGLLFTLLTNGIFWYLVVKSSKENPFHKVGRSIFLIGVSIFFIAQFAQTYENSQIRARVSENTDDSRAALVQEAFGVFIDHPLTGVGLGQFPRYSQYGKFSHNSFTEVLAEHGFVGGILLLVLFCYPLVKSIRLLSKDNYNSLYRLNFLFFLTFLFYNNAYVFYKTSYAMIYFFLIISIQHNLEKTLSKNINP